MLQIRNPKEARAALWLVIRYFDFLGALRRHLGDGPERAFREAHAETGITPAAFEKLSRLDLRSLAERAMEFIELSPEVVAMIREALPAAH